MLDERKHPIRVLHIVSLEKSNYYLENLVDHSDRLTVEFTVATLAGEGTFATELRKRRITVCCLGCTSRSQYWKAVRAVCEIIRRHNIDVVHTHLVEPTWIGLAAAKLTARAAIVTRHHSDAVYRLENPLKRWGHLRLEQCSRALADHIIAPSTCVQELLLNRERTPFAKVSLIPYGQDVRRFEAVKAVNVAQVERDLGMKKALRLVCLSRLHPEKGHLYLFKALSVLKREVPAFSLYLVGAGPHRRVLEESAQNLGIASCVKFLGWRDDALEILAAADVVVHPSLHEALPSAVIEALALKKPVIATDVSGVRDILDGYGKIVPPADSDALLQALRSTLANLETANRLAAGGKAHILETMAASKVARAHVDVYQSVLARRYHKRASTVTKAFRLQER
jgi:glycosyltransferase involved in cell wall biosynthesis